MKTTDKYKRTLDGQQVYNIGCGVFVVAFFLFILGMLYVICI